jgi:hypothetical protein
MTTTLPKFSEQERKIHEAYINDEIQPLNASFCFCGTLANGRGWYDADRYPESHPYSMDEYEKMEYALLNGVINGTQNVKDIISHPNYEISLFEGMVAALEVLKNIHIEKGEIIDEVKPFVKRKIIDHASL